MHSYNQRVRYEQSQQRSDVRRKRIKTIEMCLWDITLRPSRRKKRVKNSMSEYVVVVVILLVLTITFEWS